jgi:3-dehydroquinate synthase
MKNATAKHLVRFQKRLPAVKELQRLSGGKNFILLFDDKLTNHPAFKNWATQFDHRIALKAGESLKAVDGFANYVKNILPMMAGYSPKENVIISVGGGSVGDFSGFMASVLKRGVTYVHIPSTWLAAIDSAHGGKNGLNVGDIKNQVGTFYQASIVYCVKDLLANQPSENIKSGCGEVLKMGLLSAELFSQIERIKNINADSLWRLLPKVVTAKLKIVAKDPYETKGIRHLLNLGHTVGHAIETESLMPHGVAVQKGLEFSAGWSLRRKILSQKEHDRLKKYFLKNEVAAFSPMSADRFHKRLQQDKKATSAEKVRFVFIKKPGQPFIEEVSIADIVRVAQEMGWVR